MNNTAWATGASSSRSAMRKGVREVQCLVVYVATGFDLRLLEAGEMLRTELFQDGPLLEARAKQWQRALTGTGWK